jgi:hypothetical protein
VTVARRQLAKNVEPQAAKCVISGHDQPTCHHDATAAIVFAPGQHGALEKMMYLDEA